MTFDIGSFIRFQDRFFFSFLNPINAIFDIEMRFREILPVLLLFVIGKITSFLENDSNFIQGDVSRVRGERFRTQILEGENKTVRTSRRSKRGFVRVILSYLN